MLEMLPPKANTIGLSRFLKENVPAFSHFKSICSSDTCSGLSCSTYWSAEWGNEKGGLFCFTLFPPVVSLIVAHFLEVGRNTGWAVLVIRNEAAGGTWPS